MTDLFKVPLSQGLVAVIDADDAPSVLAAGKWSAKREGPNVYACRSVRRADGSRGFIRLHSFLTGWAYVDHRDGDGLNNIRSNLRPADPVTNGRNRRPGVNNLSGYVGVCPTEPSGRWRAYITDGDRRIHLGIFKDPVQAARARDAAALQIFGDYARMNLPHEHSTNDLNEHTEIEGCADCGRETAHARCHDCDIEKSYVGGLAPRYGAEA